MTKSCAQVEAILDLLVRVSAALKGAGVPFALTGGSAVYALGGVPSEHDVDVVVREQDVDRAVETLVESGMHRVHTPLDWLRKVGDNDRVVDLIFRSVNRPVDDETLTQAEPVKVGPIVVPVLPATTVMIDKLLVFGEHFCDFTWALPAARALREQIDWDQVRSEVGHSPFAEAFLLLADRLGLSIPPKSGPIRVATPVRTEDVAS
ncbi:MAG TPA: nucleotidyltransferase family protein [Pseudonocardiaceae bacterium]|nr:nucleotidyltransferase family protein [Pseudonocardiaceae bacterium]